MKRSRTALTLFLAMLAAALQTVGVANIHRATAGDRRQCPEACTRSRAPLHDCYAQAPAGTHSLCCYDDSRYEDDYSNDYSYEEDYGYQDEYTSEINHTYRCEAATESAADHCHVQQPCGRDAYVGTQGFDGQDPCLQSYLTNDRELPAYPIEEYVYGDAACHEAARTTCRFNTNDYCYDDYGYSCDEFDCCLESCRVHREDLSHLADDSRHSSGCQQAIDINQQNDGLAEQHDLPPSEDLSVIESTAASNSGYDYDVDYHHGWDFDCAGDDCRSHYSHDNEHHCTRAPGCLWSASRHSSLAVAVGDDVPFDLPPAEPAPVAAAPVAVQSASDDYGYDSYDDYNYEYGGEGYRSDDSASDYGYDEEPAAAVSSPATTGADHANFGADYWNDESAFQVNDLPPGEVLNDDLPPAEAHADDLPPAESIDDDLPPAEAVNDDLPPAEALDADDLPVGNEFPAASPRAEVYPDDFYEGEFYSNHSDCDALHRNHSNVECQEVQPAVEPQTEDYDNGYEYNYDESSYDDSSDYNYDESSDYSDDYSYQDEVEYRSYTDYRASDDLSSAGMSDDEASWGVCQSDDDTFYAEAPYAAPADADLLRPLLRSASWVLGQMGQSLLDLSKSVEGLAAPAPVSETVETEPEQTDVESYSPWPSTIGRQPGVDCPLEL